MFYCQGFNSECNIIVFHCESDNYSGKFGDLDLEDDDPLMQFTGLRDKNDKEIYEVDVLGFAIKSRDVVRYDNGGFKIEKVYLGAGIESGLPIGDVKVIGNIYENPELLQSDQ